MEKMFPPSQLYIVHSMLLVIFSNLAKDINRQSELKYAGICYSGLIFSWLTLSWYCIGYGLDAIMQNKTVQLIAILLHYIAICFIQFSAWPLMGKGIEEYKRKQIEQMKREA